MFVSAYPLCSFACHTEHSWDQHQPVMACNSMEDKGTEKKKTSPNFVDICASGLCCPLKLKAFHHVISGQLSPARLRAHPSACAVSTRCSTSDICDGYPSEQPSFGANI